MTYPLMPIHGQQTPIVERLRIAFPARTFTIERVPQVLSINEFRRVVRLAPFIGLAWVGMRPDPAAGRMLKGVQQWRLILVNKASGGLEARFRGDKFGLGMDAMIDVSAVLLHGMDFRGLGHTAVTAANSVIADGWSDDDIAIAQVDFTFTFAATIAATGLQTPDDFRALGVTWSVSDDEDADTAGSIINPPQD